MNTSFLAAKFAMGLPYNDYVATGTEEQQRRWKAVYDAACLSRAQGQLIGTFVREMNVLVVSGVWCGDCVQQCPLLQHIAQANPKIHLTFVDRDRNRDLEEAFHANGGDRVPMAIFMAEDHEWCATYGDRSLSRSRALVRKLLGAACSTGVVVPDQEEMEATLQDWINEFERIQLMLRLSPRLRQKHGD